MSGKLGIAHAPSSIKALDREKMKLVPCNTVRCKNGKHFKELDEIGNFSPCAAFGGWDCAFNNYTTVQKKLLATQFCEHASSLAISAKTVSISYSTGKY